MSEVIKVLAGLIQRELSLQDGQVLLYNQKWDTPADERLYVVVGFLGFKVFGNSTWHESDPVTGTLNEVLRINRQETYSIHVFSRGTEALMRNQEVLYALSSDAAQRAQEEHCFRLGTVPVAFNDLSEQDGAAILYRYNLTLNALVGYSRTRPVPLYDQFQVPPRTLLVNP